MAYSKYIYQQYKLPDIFLAIKTGRLVLNLSQDDAGVVTTEAQRIAQGNIDFCLAGMERHIVYFEVATGVGVLEVNSRGDN